MIDPKTLSGTWSYPTQILFGPGNLKKLPRACESLGMTRPLLVTDPGLADLPMIRQAIEINEAAGLPTGLFSQVKPNPVGQNVADGAGTSAINAFSARVSATVRRASASSSRRAAMATTSASSNSPST